MSKPSAMCQQPTSARSILLTDPAPIRAELVDRGFAWVPRTSWSIGPELVADLERFRAEWDDLEVDRYLANGARFRERRYGRFSWAPETDVFTPLPEQPYFQPAEQNAYAGGMQRRFAPVRPSTLDNPFVRALVRACFACLPVPDEHRDDVWEVHLHQMRILARPDAPGLPTPEGMHQDGTEFQTLHLLRRDHICGGETTIAGLDRSPLFRCTMREVMDTLILEDPRVLHGVTPVLPNDGNTGIRDVFGLDYYHRPQQRSEVVEGPGDG